METQHFIGVCFFIFGSIIGSFLNVCIVRLPHEESIVKPRSHCVKCKTLIPWYHNIPIVSYIVLGGKAKCCGAKISFRYFIVEVLTGATFWFFYSYFGLDRIIWPYLVMVCGFIVATFVDFKHRIIPDEVSVGGMCIGIIFSIFIPEMHILQEPGESIWIVHVKSFGLSLFGVLIGGGSIYIMGLLGDFLFKKESMGGGDVKLMAMVGAFLGWQISVLAFFIAPIFGAVFGVIEKIRTKDSAIPYGPFLVLGTLIGMFWGDQIIRWILSGYGFY